MLVYQRVPVYLNGLQLGTGSTGFSQVRGSSASDHVHLLAKRGDGEWPQHVPTPWHFNYNITMAIYGYIWLYMAIYGYMLFHQGLSNK